MLVDRGTHNRGSLAQMVSGTVLGAHGGRRLTQQSSRGKASAGRVLHTIRPEDAQVPGQHGRAAVALKPRRLPPTTPPRTHAARGGRRDPLNPLPRLWPQIHPGLHIGGGKTPYAHSPHRCSHRAPHVRGGHLSPNRLVLPGRARVASVDMEGERESESCRLHGGRRGQRSGLRVACGGGG